MPFEDGALHDELNAWKAKYATLKESTDRVQEDARTILTLFAARKRSDGSFDIDFDKLVANLGVAKSLELRQVIDETWRVSGAPGEKPRLRVMASS